MKRGVLVGCVAVMALVAVLARQRPEGVAPPHWASKAMAEPTTVAVLLEFGLKDTNIRDWSGRASVEGAKVVRREGYRFRSEDQLVKPDGWKVASHRGLRAPKGQPQISKLEPIASVGVVLQLQDVKDDAALTVALAAGDRDKMRIPLKEVLTGQPVKLWEGTAVARLISTSTPVATTKNEEDFPAAAYTPEGALWVAYISYRVLQDERRIEAPMLKDQPRDFERFYTPEYGEQLLVKLYRQGKWSEALPLTGPKEDLARCAVAVDGSGIAWVAYSAQREGNFDIYARSLTPRGEHFQASQEYRLTTQAGPDLNPVMCTDANGDIWLASQSWKENGQARIEVWRCQKREWMHQFFIEGGDEANCWHPAMAADSAGKVAIAYDIYKDHSDYDVHVTIFDTKTSKQSDQAVASSPKFEARPSIAYDRDNRLWIAYEEGPEKWGKDYGALSANKGKPLYNERSVRVLCVDKGQVKRPAAELPTSAYDPPVIPFEPVKTNAYERVTRYAYPTLGIDLKGRVWLAYRQNFGSRYTSHPGSYWLTFVRRLDASGWTPPVELHHSDGLLDHRPVLLPHVTGGLLVLHNTDGRYTTPEVIDNQIHTSVIGLPQAAAGTPELVQVPPRERRENAEASREREAVQRIREYRIEAGGKKLQILRGEFHRHTEISWDGGADGSLEDMFRYGIDCARMDWIGNGDHDNGAGREYSWWLIQKFTDAYHVAERFTPMFAYERSVAYPHGHRNCMFAKRGIRTLPRLAPRPGVKEEGLVHPDDAKMLYRYLREHHGICASHTSATSMGTDWRDNDPVVEPIVEIYQGDRMSYEHQNAPRTGYDPKTGKEPANVAGWFPKGFISNALGKGYKLGFQASSDHWSTHISYCMVLAEKHDRQGILDAIKKRHTYGATDNIIVDFRSGDAIMGDAIKTRQAPTFQIVVEGTGDLHKIDVLRDSEVVATLKAQGAAHKANWTDPQPDAGLHYYYIRVLQEDGELAWASPIWIDHQK